MIFCSKAVIKASSCRPYPKLISALFEGCFNPVLTPFKRSLKMKKNNSGEKVLQFPSATAVISLSSKSVLSLRLVRIVPFDAPTCAGAFTKKSHKDRQNPLSAFATGIPSPSVSSKDGRPKLRLCAIASPSSGIGIAYFSCR